MKMTALFFEVYQKKSGKWWWRLIDADSRVIAVSPKGYKDKEECLELLRLVKRVSKRTDVI